MIRFKTAFLFTAVLGCASNLLSGNAPPSQSSPQSGGDLAYHDHPPQEPLPPTLDPEAYRENHAAFVSYKLAAAIKNTLYQVPCYCPCRRGLGHQSLLDCYTSKHGELCPTCQREVLFCYLQQKKGKSPAEIRDAMAKGKAAKLNLAKTVDRLYQEIQRAGK